MLTFNRSSPFFLRFSLRIVARRTKKLDKGRKHTKRVLLITTISTNITDEWCYFSYTFRASIIFIASKWTERSVCDYEIYCICSKKKSEWERGTQSCKRVHSVTALYHLPVLRAPHYPGARQGHVRRSASVETLVPLVSPRVDPASSLITNPASDSVQQPMDEYI